MRVAKIGRTISATQYRGLAQEWEHQTVVAGWLHSRRPKIWYCAVPLGELRDPRVGAKLKKMGSVPGFPDIAIITPAPRVPGTFATALELKRVGGVVRPDQKAWLAELERLSWHVIVAFGADDAIKQLEQSGY